MYYIAIHQNKPYADLIDYFRSQGFTVDVRSEDELIEGVAAKAYDLAISEDIDTIRSIKGFNASMAIVYMPKSEDCSEGNSIEALLAGADICIVRPFSLRYALSCIQALLKRVGNQAIPANYTINAYTFIPKDQLLIIGDLEKKLTLRETQVLTLMCQYKGALLPKELVLREVWRENNYFNKRTLNTIITYLRRHFVYDKRIKIESIKDKGYIFTTE